MTFSELKRWTTPRIQAEIWRCNDTCRCFQPRIYYIWPNMEDEYPALSRRQIWEGTYLQGEPDEKEWDQMRTELREAALRMDIVLDGNDAGERPYDIATEKTSQWATL